MKQIVDFTISRLRTEESYNFLSRVKSAAVSNLSLETDQAMVESFVAAVTAFDEALKASAKNSKTAAMQEADSVADLRWSGANGYVKAMRLHPDEETAALANTVYEIFLKYGVLTTMGYDEEYGNYQNLMGDLSTLPAETLTALNLHPWIESMSTALARFQIARDAKTFEDTTRQTGIVKEKRLAAEDSYRTTVQRINALAIVNGEDAYATFIDTVNVMIADLQAVLAGRATKAANQKEQTTEG